MALQLPALLLYVIAYVAAFIPFGNNTPEGLMMPGGWLVNKPPLGFATTCTELPLIQILEGSAERVGVGTMVAVMAIVLVSGQLIAVGVTVIEYVCVTPFPDATVGVIRVVCKFVNPLNKNVAGVHEYVYIPVPGVVENETPAEIDCPRQMVVVPGVSE